MTTPPAGPIIPFLLDYLYWLRDRVLATAAGLDAPSFLATPEAPRSGPARADPQQADPPRA